MPFWFILGTAVPTTLGVSPESRIPVVFVISSGAEGVVEKSAKRAQNSLHYAQNSFIYANSRFEFPILYLEFVSYFVFRYSNLLLFGTRPKRRLSIITPMVTFDTKSGVQKHTASSVSARL